MDALRVAPGESHSLDCQSDYFAAVSYQHHLVVGANLPDADHLASLVGHVHRDDALAAAMREPVVRSRRAFAVTEFRNRQESFVVAHGGHRNDFVLDQRNGLAFFDGLRLKFHADYATGRAAHWTRLFFLEANRLSLTRREHDLLIAVGDSHVDQRVAVFEIDRDDSGRPNIFVLVERGLLYAAAASREKDKLARGFARHRNESRQRFVVGETQQVCDRASLGGAPALGQFVGLELVNLAGAGEEQQAVVGRDALEMLDEVLFGGGRADLSAATALLRAVERERGALDVAAVRDGDEDIFFDD